MDLVIIASEIENGSFGTKYMNAKKLRRKRDMKIENVVDVNVAGLFAEANEDDVKVFFDPLSARYFLSTYRKIRVAESKLIREIVEGPLMYATVEDWYNLLGIPAGEMSKHFGWAMEVNSFFGVSFDDATFLTGEPYRIIRYEKPPVALYSHSEHAFL